MPVIKKRHVKKSTKRRKCDGCFRWIICGSACFYFYGMAHRGETPYPLYVCEDCEAERVRLCDEIESDNAADAAGRVK